MPHSSYPPERDAPAANPLVGGPDRAKVSECARNIDTALLTEIVDRLPHGVSLHDEGGRVLFANETAIRHGRLKDIGRHTPNRIADRAGKTPSAERTFEVTAETSLGQRNLLVTQSSIETPDRNLLLSSSVDITKQAQREADLVRLAYFDELTGLPNRRVIESGIDEIARHAQEEDRFALAFLDLDGFKQINDYYGHAIGDALLAAFAQRIGFYLRPSDMLARISGDEFLLLLSPIRDQQEVYAYFEAVLQKLKAPYVLDGTEVFGSASVGIALYPEHGSSYEALRQNADIAMYRAKSDKNGSIAFFDHSMEHEAQERMKSE